MKLIRKEHKKMNYIMLNNKKIELTPEQIKEMEQSFGLGKVKLADVEVGDTFKVGGYEFIVLEHSSETTAVILKDMLFEEKTFGENNNYDGSNVDTLCNDFGNEIESLVGAGNLIVHTVDLTADDGLKCYGSAKRKMSLLTAALYRRYVYTLDKFKIAKWWWLSTAFSTPVHEDSTWVKCVSPRGDFIDVDDCNYGCGVRPFCILNSNIFVSK